MARSATLAVRTLVAAVLSIPVDILDVTRLAGLLEMLAERAVLDDMDCIDVDGGRAGGGIEGGGVGGSVLMGAPLMRREAVGETARNSRDGARTSSSASGVNDRVDVADS